MSTASFWRVRRVPATRRRNGDMWRLRGEAVSAMDLLIGTAALLREASLITRNPKDFQRIPGLKVLSH
jgi:predicted nucleic acid-binding protein